MSRAPLVFVPGFPASSLETTGGTKVFPPSVEDLADPEALVRRLQGPDDPNLDDGVRARSPIRYTFRIPLLDAGKEAQSLYDLLEDLGYDTENGDDFAPVGWDWRRSIDATQTLDAVEEAIRRLAVAGRGVTILCHSTGGLVTWCLLQQRSALLSLVEQVVAIGVPWGGLIKSFIYVRQGNRVGIGPITLLTADQSRRLMSRAHAAYDLLPPQPTNAPVLPLFTRDGAAVSPLVERSWVPTADSAAYELRLDGALGRLGRRGNVFPTATPVWNLAGWGVPMTTAVELADFSERTSDEGDGTVPFASASCIAGGQVRTFPVPAGVYADQLITQKHSQLWNTPPVKRFLRQRLVDGAAGAFLAVSIDGDSAVDPRAPLVLRVAGTTSEGAAIPDLEVSFPTLPGRPRAALAGRTRARLTLPRGDLRPNVGHQLYRFHAELCYGGGQEVFREPLVVTV
jgi:hypothetical protein